MVAEIKAGGTVHDVTREARNFSFLAADVIAALSVFAHSLHHIVVAVTVCTILHAFAVVLASVRRASRAAILETIT